MSRLPIRIRLGLAFALAMAFVLAVTGTYLYLRLESSLDESVDEVLEARMLELGARVAEGGADFDLGGASGLGDAEERFAQLVDGSGDVVDATSRVGSAPLLGADDLERAAAGLAVRRELDVRTIAGRARLLATGVSTPDGPRVLIVGTSLEDRDETMRQFLAVLAAVGPLALLLTSLLGYALATAALRPVESMRAEAEAISGTAPERRLPLPSSRDEIRRLGETLNEMLDRLELALERERSFVSDASHELRTPLAALRTELELALRRPRSQHELEAALRSALEEVERLSRLADDLLVLARSDEGQLRPGSEPVCAVLLLEAVARRFEARAAAAGRVLVVSGASGEKVVGDRVRLEQALGNLVDNSLRHGDGTVELRAESADGRVTLRVSDSGQGFPPVFLPEAFERFRRADEARAGGGTGLGLAIVEAIARAHGGTVAAANREKGGAVVTLTLPAAASSSWSHLHLIPRS